MKGKYVIAAMTLAASQILLGNTYAEQLSRPYLGTCDPKLKREKYYKYECQRNDGSIGWLLGTRIGSGSPIIGVNGQDTENAYLLTKLTTKYPGYSCYYSEPNGLNTPSQACIKSISRASLMKPEKIKANCLNVEVSYENGERYRYWTKGTYSLYWLAPGSRPTYFEDGRPEGMPGGTDGWITEAFRILCPAKFKSMNAPLPYGKTF